MQPSKMTISRLAQAAGIGVETVRYYHRRGLLPIPKTVDGKYREYNPTFLQQLRFIQRAQAAGFSLAEIKQLISFDPIIERDQIQTITSQRLKQLTLKIKELQNIAIALHQVLTECEHTPSHKSCPIIKILASEGLVV